jgi:APA family basic amino acid/polyamine antiporter
MHCVFGSRFAHASRASERHDAPHRHPMTFSGLIVALQAIVITYGGWQSPLYFIEEDRDPVRNLPRADDRRCVVGDRIYLLVNVALPQLLPMTELSGADLPGG